MSTHDHDPLERLVHRRLIVLAAVVAIVGAFSASVTSVTPTRLPGVALESPLLLHIERSLVVAGAVAGVLVFLLRGWAGYFPSKVSASGAEYAVRSAASDAAQNEDDISEALKRVVSGHRVLADSLGEDIRTLERRLDRLAHTSRETHDHT